MKVSEKLEKLEKERALLVELLKMFPDLEENTGRFDRVYFSSALVNELAQDFKSGNTCGCCNDPGYYIAPYVKYEEVYIYGNPDRFVIGTYNKAFVTSNDVYYPSSYDIRDGWDDNINVNQNLLEKIRKHVNSIRKEDSYSEIEDLDGTEDVGLEG
jgi:hypothetical protein